MNESTRESTDTSALKSQLEKAAFNLFEHQPDIFAFTSETGQTEWNLAHHLACELQEMFGDFSCDLDVIKPNYGDRRPDIILHRRGTHKLNFLVIEVKRDGNLREIEADIAKIHEFWFREPLQYKFGSVVDLRKDKSFTVHLFENRI